ncbi:hypothetical protein [Leeuwenhoekiella sp. NPDC079379]|uniref:hypothetical protein n=1 Tax=Leeuwenhoekiella sp. NPDC079379 TaxID=3364122 RepID=UPI0037C9404E
MNNQKEPQPEKTFAQHINLESFTINEFFSNQPQIQLTEILNESYSRYDFEFLSGNTSSPIKKTGLVEVKTRQKNYYDFGDSGVLIELDKYNALFKECQSRKMKNINLQIQPFYLVRYPDVEFLFDLSQVEVNKPWWISCPVSSSSNGYNGYIDKACFFLPSSGATITTKF